MASQSRQIPIRVRKATRADIDDIVRVNVDAFGPGVMNKLMYPHGMSDYAKSKFASSMIKIVDDAEASASDDSKPKAKQSFLLVAEIDSAEERSSPEVIAFAWWDVWREPRLEDEWNVPEPVSTDPAEGANDEIMEVFIGGIRAMRRRNMRGDPGVCKLLHFVHSLASMLKVRLVTDSSIKGVRMLCCTPTRTRLGAGSALLRWGAQLADREGLPSWLEASPQGHPLYRRFGFEDVDVLDVHVTEKWGAIRSPNDDWGANAAVGLVGAPPEGIYRSVGMRRLPIKG
jgi:hypothetical protein